MGPVITRQVDRFFEHGIYGCPYDAGLLTEDFVDRSFENSLQSIPICSKIAPMSINNSQPSSAKEAENKPNH